jgi:chitodextrinase
VATSGPDTQPPTGPTLLSAAAKSANEVDLLWTASSDNVGVAGYQIIRNGVMVSSVPGAALVYVDNTVAAGVTYTYSVAAYDAAGNVSSPSAALQVTTPTAPPPVVTSTCPGPANGAFTGCYYANTTLSGNPTLVRTDNQVNFDWANGAPDRSLTPLNFSATWQGQFTFAAGTYVFTIITSDGMRVSIDGNSILDQWRDQSPMIYTVTQSVSQGTHLISIQYYERTGGATAHVNWTLNSSTPPPPAQPPVISSFLATPSNASAGQAVSLAWALSGASSVSIDQGVGDVTGRTSVVVTPAATTTYTLTASSAAGATATSAVTVNVTSGGGGTGGGGQTQAPTTPTLVSAVASTATEVDLTWTASSSPAGIGSDQVFRDGYPLASVSGSTLAYADKSVVTSSSYAYTVRAYDPAGNASAPSNSIQVTTPASSGITITWYGPCWYSGTIGGITGNFQAVDFSLVTPTPVPLQGTLFDGPNCTASGGDNMNDYNTLTGTTHMIQGFTHYPNQMPMSAIYWIGDRTPDGRCPPGSTLCSGCVNYNSSTLSCSMMP